LIFPLWLLQDGVLGWSLATQVFWVRRKWGWLLVGTAATIGVGLVERWFMFSAADGGDRSARSFGEIAHYSRHLDLYFRKAGDQTIGHISVYMLLLALVAVAELVRRKKIPWSAVKYSPLIPLAVTLPFLLLLMTGVGENWSQKTGLYEFAYDYLPFFSAQRVPGKMFGLNGLFIMVILVGCYKLLSTEIKQGWLRAVLYALLLVTGLRQGHLFVQANAEGRCGLVLEKVIWEVPKLFAYLRSDLGPDDIVLNIPFNENVNRMATLPQYLSLRTKARFASGYFVMPPAEMLAAEPELSLFNWGKITSRNLSLAERQGYTHVLLVREGWELEGTNGAQVEKAFESSSHLNKLFCEERFCLYKLAYSSPVPDSGPS
jgi:hypothetical protein